MTKISDNNASSKKFNSANSQTSIRDNQSFTSVNISVTQSLVFTYYPADIYLFQVNDGNTRKIFLMLTIETEERRQSPRSGVFIVNFEQISHFVLAFPLLTLKQ